MLTRLSVGRVEPWELVLSVSLLVGTILVTSVVAIRIYGAGVLLYGQRPGLRAYVAAARGQADRPAARRRSSALSPRRAAAAGGSGRRPARTRPTALLDGSGSGDAARRARSPAGDERRRRTATAGSVTPGRYGLVRWRAMTPAIPCAAAASWSARPSPAIAGTATTSSPGRRTCRSVSRRRLSGADSSERPSRCRRSNAR